jgi:hypothetical protein
MGTLSPTGVRLRRLLRLFQEVHEQTGSLTAAAGYISRFTVMKLPILARQLRSIRRRSGIVQELAAAREGPEADVLRVGIRVSGGLGDFLVIARFLRDLAQFTGGFTFDIYSTEPNRARWVFGAVDGFNACHDELLFEFVLGEYDIAFRISQFIVVQETVARWQRLRPHGRLVQAAANVIRYRPKIEAFIERHPLLDGFLAQKAIYSNRTRANFLHHMAGIPYGGDELNIPVSTDAPERYGLRRQQYITVHNGYDPGFVVHDQRATKCYPHFGAVVSLVKQRWPGLQFVQVGTSTSEHIREVDLSLVGRTSLFEAAGVIEGARLHIDNEGGLVHLARCLGVDSCVVFGPTPSAYFGYSANVNIDPSFCGGCWWINETWMNKCPRGFATARCMTEQDPRVVAAAIGRYLQDRVEPGVHSKAFEVAVAGDGSN